MPSFVIVSLWNMLRIDTDTIFPPLGNVMGSLSEWRVLMQLENVIPAQRITTDYAARYIKSIQIIKDTAISLGMKTTQMVVESEYDEIFDILASQMPKSGFQFQKLASFSEKLWSVFTIEIKSRSIISLNPGHSEFLLSCGPVFGDSVDNAFPSAAQEIADAAKCRALGMWTAVVMHLMRALEDPLAALGRHVGTDITANWNSALNQIDAKLKEHNKRSVGEDGEQWAAEASAHLRNIKNAWRNHAAHGRARYNEEEAVAIWNNVQALMQTLAKRLEE